MELSSRKVITREQAAKITAQAREAGQRSGFTSGTFDLLHPGHVAYLEDARMQCDVLIAGVNSDRSVREYKSAKRPICDETARASVVAGLGCVDYVFIFDEKNNHENITALKPDVYFKAGDYAKESLTSAGIVEAYGGCVVLIPFRTGYSSTAIIEKIELLSDRSFAPEEPVAALERRPAVILDRDGTIIELSEYLSEPQKVKLLPGAVEGLRAFQAAGYRIVLVTNQPGIGMGYFSREDLFRVNRELLRQLSAQGILVDKIYFCPHSKAEGCACRKPKPLFVQRAERELNLDLSRSVVIGDMTSDVQFAKNAGCQSVLVTTGKGGSDALYEVAPDYTCGSIQEAAACGVVSSR